MEEIVKPTLFEKGISEDHRGSLEYYNKLNLEPFKRFYIVTNPKRGTVRAWHGHKIEAKLIKVIKGEFVIGTVEINDWDNPSPKIKVEQFRMNENTGVVYVPPGYANGAINLIPNSKVIYFSSLNLDESSNDDYRFNSKFWDPWADYSPEIYE